MTDPDDLIRMIGNAVASAAPAGWVTAWVRAVDVSADHARTEYDYVSEDGVEAWFDHGMELSNAVSTSFIRLLSAMIASGQPVWTGATLVVQRNGHFNVRFSYEP